MMRLAAAKVAPVVESLMQQYDLDRSNAVLLGGGGGSGALVPFVGEFMGLEARLARNHHVISPIGVALALVREVVERTKPNPTEEDILSIRQEALEAAIRSGAAPGTRARRCREIAPHAFARELLGLPFLPNAVDYLILVATDRWSEAELSRALARAEEELMAAVGRQEGSPDPVTTK